MTANEARELSKDREGLLIGGVVDRHIILAVRKGKTECVVGWMSFRKTLQMTWYLIGFV